MASIEQCITKWMDDVYDPASKEEIMKDPITACQYADYVEDYQWAIQHWFHADVCVLDEIDTSQRNPYFGVVLEFWGTDDHGDPSFKSTRMFLSSNELVGMYQYYKKFSESR